MAINKQDMRALRRLLFRVPNNFIKEEFFDYVKSAEPIKSGIILKYFFDHYGPP